MAKETIASIKKQYEEKIAWLVKEKAELESKAQDYRFFKLDLARLLDIKEDWNVDERSIIKEIAHLEAFRSSVEGSERDTRKENARLWYMIRSLTHDVGLTTLAQALPDLLKNQNEQGYRGPHISDPFPG